MDRCEIYEGWRWEGGTARDHPEIFSQMPKPSNSQTIDRRMDNDDAYGASNAKQTPSNISDFLSHTESTARRAIAIVLRASGPLMKGGYYSVVVYYETPQRFSPRCWPPMVEVRILVTVLIIVICSLAANIEYITYILLL